MARKKFSDKVILEEIQEEPMTAPTQELESIQQEIDVTRKELEATRSELEKKREELRANPRREVEDWEKANSDKQINRGNLKVAQKETLDKLQAYDSVMVTGRFINRRNPGAPAKLCYMKWPEDPPKWHELEDGKVYTIPRGFAEQIRDYYHTPKFIQKQVDMNPDRPTSAIHGVDNSQKKYDFASINW